VKRFRNYVTIAGKLQCEQIKFRVLDNKAKLNCDPRNYTKQP
jgi:hypothetical protein